MLERLGSQFETASAGYAGAHGIERDPDWFILKMQEELGELTQVWNKLSGRGRRHGVSTDELTALMADETADLLGHVLLFAHHHKLDLSAAIERKWRFQAVL
ncbi:pyrophosphatase [Ensifer sp. SSB1]|uniref:pyrophosphatase n=1 Tax=Ensifer sp. SSB1 TaxID=2795385 RepID=UPI001A366FC5|nr:pyrophosphatase [Ensifer sp. SSB1]MBK5567221.1 pyrophosphatase [Ensifer sp. SSB1]